MMRSKKYLAVVLSLLMLCGCNSVEDRNIISESDEKLIVKQFSLHADVAYQADSLGELYEDSAFIAEISVTETTPAFLEGSPLLCTYFEADVLNTYKGEYHGETFYTDGGCMKLSDYITASDTEANVEQFTAEELQNGYVALDFMGSHIPETGERLLIFGKYAEGSPIICITSLGQSLYLCDEENVSLTCLQDTSSDLLADLEVSCNAAVTNSLKTVTAVCDKSALIESVVK